MPTHSLRAKDRLPRPLRRLATVSVLLAAIALPAMADIYKSVDAEGRVTYSNLPMRGAKRLDLGPMPTTLPAPRGARGTASRARAADPSPINFPKVDDATQKVRDQSRRGILMEELGREQTLLADARRELAGAPQNAKAQDNVTFHEKNIEALQKEMSRIK
jgi:hypothetical protein